MRRTTNRLQAVLTGIIAVVVLILTGPISVMLVLGTEGGWSAVLATIVVSIMLSAAAGLSIDWPGPALAVAWAGVLVQLIAALPPLPVDVAILMVLYATGAAANRTLRITGLASAVAQLEAIAEQKRGRIARDMHDVAAMEVRQIALDQAQAMWGDEGAAEMDAVPSVLASCASTPAANPPAQAFRKPRVRQATNARLSGPLVAKRSVRDVGVGQPYTTYTYDGEIPGATRELRSGDTIGVTLRNDMPPLSARATRTSRTGGSSTGRSSTMRRTFSASSR